MQVTEHFKQKIYYNQGSYLGDKSEQLNTVVPPTNGPASSIDMNPFFLHIDDDFFQQYLSPSKQPKTISFGLPY